MDKVSGTLIFFGLMAFFAVAVWLVYKAYKKYKSSPPDLGGK